MSAAERLVREAAQAGGDERERLLQEAMVCCLPLAVSLARRYRAKGEPDDDLEQVAAMAMVKAVRRYRPGPDTSLVGFAVPTVHGELKRYFRDSTWLLRPPRRLQELRIAVRALVPSLTQELSRAPSTVELAQRLQVAEEELVEMAVASEGYAVLSLDAPDGQSSVEPAEPGADAQVMDDVLRMATVLPVLDALPARDQRAVAMHYYGGLSQQQIAADLGVSQVQVSRLLSAALATVRAAVEAAD